MNIFLNKKQFYLFILFYSICSIFFALYVEHILQYKACTLCIYQRIPFLISFLIGNFGSAMKKIIEKKLLKFSLILSFLLIIFAYLIYKFLINFMN